MLITSIYNKLFLCELSPIILFTYINLGGIMTKNLIQLTINFTAFYFQNSKKYNN